MMENKCNKTPNKYLDHVYCQPGEGKNYMRNNNSSGGGGSTGADVLALLKENKQLKAMLILHLDLIQEQSDQLIAKDKQIHGLKEELQTVRAKNAQFEVQIQELQRQVQRNNKRTAAAPLGELSLLSPPPLAKIQCKKDNNSASPTNIIGECNGKLISKIILQRVNLPDGTIADNHSPNSTTTTSDTASEETSTHHHHEEQEEVEEDVEELTTEESNDATSLPTTTTGQEQDPALIPRGAKPRPALGSVTPTLAPVKVCVTPPTPSRGKQMPLMLWHAPNIHSEEDSGSCEDSTADVEQQQTDASPSFQSKTQTTETPKTKSRKVLQQAQGLRQQNQRQNQSQQKQNAQKHKRRCAYISTQQMYATREWEDEDEAVCDYEFSQAEAEALHAEAPMLEIPKWTEHELSPSYCIEGTEDLSDESFLKRHAKLEIDEKRRKKWDVQQIREQRRIEKLKRRHCKNEVQTTEHQILKSFYPQLDTLQSICFVNELPVQAFGEMLPKLNTSGDFVLPWLQTETNNSITNPAPSSSLLSSTSSTTTTTMITPTTTTIATASASMTPTTMMTNNGVEVMLNSAASSTCAQTQAQMLKSCFVFLKKRKRQQSSSVAGGAVSMSRQRPTANTKVTQSTTPVAVIPTVICMPAPEINTLTSETSAKLDELVNPAGEEKK